MFIVLGVTLSASYDILGGEESKEFHWVPFPMLEANERSLQASGDPTIGPSSGPSRENMTNATDSDFQDVNMTNASESNMADDFYDDTSGTSPVSNATDSNMTNATLPVNRVTGALHLNVSNLTAFCGSRTEIAEVFEVAIAELLDIDSSAVQVSFESSCNRRLQAGPQSQEGGTVTADFEIAAASAEQAVSVGDTLEELETNDGGGNLVDAVNQRLEDQGIQVDVLDIAVASITVEQWTTTPPPDASDDDSSSGVDSLTDVPEPEATLELRDPMWLGVIFVGTVWLLLEQYVLVRIPQQCVPRRCRRKRDLPPLLHYAYCGPGVSEELRHKIKFSQSEFLSTPCRTFKNFVSPPGERAHPPEPVCTLQAQYEGGRLQLYRRILDTSILRARRLIMAVILLAFAMTWGMRMAPNLYEFTNHSLVDPETVHRNFGAIARAHKVVLTLSSFALSFHVAGSLSRFHGIVDSVWKVQDSIHGLAMILGTLLMPHRETQWVQEELWAAYRYLNTSHLLVHTEVSDRMRLAVQGLALMDAGLLEQEELDALELAEREGAASAVLLWISSLINRLMTTPIVSPSYAQVLLDTLSELLDSSSLLVAEVKRASPCSMQQTIQVMAGSVSMLTPPALAYVFHSEGDGLHAYAVSALGSAIVAAFFHGAANLTDALAHPFADSLDALNPDWALMSTERRVFGCLAGELQPLPKLAFLAERQAQYAAEHAMQLQHQHADDGQQGVLGSAAEHEMLKRLEASQATQAARAPQYPQQGAQLDGSVAAEWDVPSEPVFREGSIASEGSVLGTPRPGMPQSAKPGLPWDLDLRDGGLNRNLLEACWQALTEPRDITLDDASLTRLEEVVVQPLNELAEALMGTELPQRSGLDGSAAPEENASTEQVVLDLVSQLHQQLRLVSELRAQVASARAGPPRTRAPPRPAVSRLEPTPEDDAAADDLASA